MTLHSWMWTLWSSQLCTQVGNRDKKTLSSLGNGEAETVPKTVCQRCRVREAVIRCGECLPAEWYCVECDPLLHKDQTLHNRQTTIFGYYKYIPPTESVKLIDGTYTICEQGLCVFQ